MKKVLIPVLCLLLIFIGGCTAKEDAKTSPTDGVADTGADSAADKQGGAAMTPPAGGIKKLTETEVKTLRDKADALFIIPPAASEGNTATLAEYQKLIDSLPKAKKAGNTRYVKFLETHYKLDADKWVKNEDARQCVVEAWHKESATAKFKLLTRWEFLYLWDEWWNQKDGETDCFIDLYNDFYGDHDCYNWLKSATEGRPLLPTISELIFSDIEVPVSAEALYYTFPDQTVNGHPCKVFGSSYEGERLRYWYATDLGRTLIAAKWNVSGYMEFCYSYDEQYFDAADNFFDPPKNVTFSE